MSRLFPFLFLVACGGSKDSAAPEPTVRLTYRVYDGLTDAPVPGAVLCDWPDATTCTTSDADGMVEQDVSPGIETHATLEADGYYGRMFSMVTPTRDTTYSGAAMLSDAGLTLLGNLTGLEFDPAGGVIGFETYLDPGHEQQRAGIAVSADSALEGPYFTAEDLSGFDMEATETNGIGAGAFINVPPGEHTLTFEGGDCTLDFGLAGAASNQGRVPVIAGHWSQITMVCPSSAR